MDENKILDLLEKIYVDAQDTKSDIKEIKSEVKKINLKLDAVVEQTANLTEFRNETISGLKDIKSDLNDVEMVTSKNWNEIAKLKAVK